MNFTKITNPKYLKQHPIVIHISGSPGSGKTRLVAMLQEQIPNIYVIDTDEMLEDSNPLVIQMRTLNQSTEAYVTLWKRAVRESILHHIDMVRNQGKKYIVFSGILNNMNGPIGGIVDISDIAHQKYFLAPPLPTLLRRFYGRLSTVENPDEFWEGVSTGIYPIPSSKKYKKDHEEEKEWHVQHGYTIVQDQETAIANIIKIIS